MHKHTVQIFLTSSLLSSFLLSCGSDRVNIEFRTPRQIYVDDSKTDPDELNKELEYDLREIEKKRRQKEREAEAAKAKAEAKQKARGGQSMQEPTTNDETVPSEKTEPP